MTTETHHLLDRAERGDLEARTRLLDRHRDQLRRMVSVRLDRRLRSRLDASDVVQEALTQAAQKLSDYIRERPVPFYAWLRRLTWEQLIRLHERHFKARRRTVLREVGAFDNLPNESIASLADRLVRVNSELAPDHRLLKTELKSRVLRALEKLSEKDRDLLILRYLEGATNSEIATAMNCSEGAIRTRHTRALTRLAQLMEPEVQE